jgi:hypothetical protein
MTKSAVLFYSTVLNDSRCARASGFQFDKLNNSLNHAGNVQDGPSETASTIYIHTHTHTQ